MSIWKKIGKVAKKALPFAAAALPFIPGVGTALGSAVGGIMSKVGGAFGGSSAQSVASTGPPDPNNPTEFQSVGVTAKRDPFDWAGALGQAAQVGIPAFMQYRGQQQTNAANAQAAAKQMEFQAEQTGTSYQRGVADMKAAGLNPMLAYSQGGAASGGGASYQEGNSLGSAASSALSVAQARQQMAQTAAQTTNIEADTANKAEQTENIKADTLQKYASTSHTGTQQHETAQRVAQIALGNQLAAATQGFHISSAKSGADYDLARSQGEKASLAGKHAEEGFWKTGYGKAYPHALKTAELANSARRAVLGWIPGSN